MADDRQFDTVAVIVGRDLIGDGLLKLPFVRQLRAVLPTARITWITTDGGTVFAGPLRAVTAALIDEVVEMAPIGERLGSLFGPPGFARRFDLLIDTRGRWRHAVLARRVPHGRFVSAAARFLLSDVGPGWGYRRPDHIVDRLNDLLALAVGRRLEPLSGAVALPAEILELAGRALPPGMVHVGLAPGTSTAIKQWPLDRFVELARLQAARGRIPAFLLGPDEAGWLPDLAAAVPAARFPLQDDAVWQGRPLTVERTIAVATRLAAAVANDSGTSHMIGAADCPLVSLFGPTQATKLAPRVSRGVVIEARSFGSSDMTAIPVAAVAEAVDRLV